MRNLRTMALSGVALLLWVGAVQANQVTSQERGTAMAPIALNSMSSPPDKIAIAKVVDTNGTIVGAVQKVEFDVTGKPNKVDVALLGTDQVIVLNSSIVSYDEPNNVLILGLNQSQLVQSKTSPHN